MIDQQEKETRQRSAPPTSKTATSSSAAEGGGANPSDETCFLCSKPSDNLIHRDDIINVNIVKIFIREEIEVYNVCSTCLEHCMREVEEIIAFRGFGEALAKELEYKNRGR